MSEGIEYKTISSSDFFDGEWYLTRNPDVKAAGMDPLEHYLLYGWKEGRDPSPKFGTAFYLRQYPDVLANGMNPLLHYLRHGQSEGRIPLAPVVQTPDFDSGDYWSKRYRDGGNSGAGSYGRLADFKAEVLNDFVIEHEVQSVIEFGCGDGNQLSLAQYPHYLGFDVAAESVALCKDRFQDDSAKDFALVKDYGQQKGDLVLSLDVIFHLVEDLVFHEYMARLFGASERYVVIYSSNYEGRDPAIHVRHRQFTKWVEDHQRDFKLIGHIPNRYPQKNGWRQDESFCDFYLYEKLAAKEHGLPGELIVSLTTYPKRFSTLEIVLRKILQQTVRADQTILWVAAEDLAGLPEGVLALEHQGLRIEGTPDIKSYKKLIPALRAFPDSYLLTFDDDGLYPADMVERIVSGYQSDSEILCNRAHRVRLDPQGQPLPYFNWEPNLQREEAGPLIFPTGIGGILYPPHSLHEDVLDESLFMRLAPKGDDLWFYWMALRGGSVVRRVGASWPIAMTPESQQETLFHYNANGGNDIQIRALVGHFGFPVS